MSKKNPFKYYKISPEIIKLAVMYYIRYPLSLRQVEDILHERGMCKFRLMGSLQKFVAIQSAFLNHFNHQRHLEKRQTFKNLRQRSIDLWQEVYAS
jgi:putative transposase